MNLKQVYFRRFFQKTCSLLANFSLFLNLFLPYLSTQPAFAEEPVPTPTPIVENAQTGVNEVDTPAEPTTIPTAEPTLEPTVVPTGVDEVDTPAEPTAVPTGVDEVDTPEITPEPTSVPTGVDEVDTPAEPTTIPTEAPTITPTITPEPTGVDEVDTPEPVNIDIGTQTPTIETTVTPTEIPIVEKVCLADETIIDSTNEDWNINETNKSAETREKVQLGVKYIFPNENKVSVTFKCLPKDESLRTTLKIQQIKTSELNLPDDIGNIGEYAYDITTGMTDGTFEYKMTLPKPEGEEVEIVYIEKSLEEIEKGLEAGEIKEVGEDKVEQKKDEEKVEVKGLDHFTVYFAETTEKIVEEKSAPIKVSLPSLSYNSSDIYALTSVAGEWTSVTGGSNITGLNTNEVRWGTSDGGTQSGLKFEGTGQQSFNEDSNFLLGTLTHFNYPISNAATGAKLKITLTFSQPAVSPNPDFSYDFKIEETPNNWWWWKCSSWQVSHTPCDDRITFPTSYGEKSFQIGDKLYTLKIQGFVSSWPGGSPVNYFITEEEKDNSAFLVGHLSSVLVERPQITLTKKVNDQDVSAAPGPNLYIGDSVTWKYIVQNTGNVDLTNVTITDNPTANIDCDPSIEGNQNSGLTLASGADMTCTATGEVVKGQFINTATVTGAPPTGSNVSASDSSWYFGTVKEFCGDGIINGSETCDEGTAINGTYGHCKADCTGMGPRCGDGVRNGSEECDDGNNNDNDLCSNSCIISHKKITLCHATPVETAAIGWTAITIDDNGIEGEAHDSNHGADIIPAFSYYKNGVLKNYAGKNLGTSFFGFTGQQILDNGCKIGATLKIVKIVNNLGGGTSLAADFKFSLNGGSYTNFGINGISEISLNIGDIYTVTESPNTNYSVNLDNCSGTISSAQTTCTITNTYIPRCGDGTTYGTEQCDDGNTINTDSCTNSCKTARCGDGIVLTGTEQCDDGNQVNTDACLNSCKLPTCGDGIKNQASEQCDGTDGVTTGYACAQKTCQLIKIYDGPNVCPVGTVKSPTPVITKTINSNDSDGEGFTLTPGGDYIFEASGTFNPASGSNLLSDAGYTLKGSILSDQYGIRAYDKDFAAHALIGNLGAGTSIGVINWGEYNSSHIYSKYFKPTSSNVQFLISDRYSNWNTEYQNQGSIGDNSGSLTLKVYECQKPPVKIYAQKVVCDNESYLPNNTQGAITASTAQNWVNNSSGHCRLVDGWNFQYGGIGSFDDFRTNTGSLPGWQTITTVSGVATATINDLTSYGNRIEVREVFPDNTYVPFSNSSSNVSAEIYCTGDGANYDNWEWINNPQYGQSYYCVAFNALKFGHLTVQKTTYPTEDESNFSVTATGSGTINGSATGIINDSTDKTYEMTPGVYSVIETVPEGWEQVSNNCTDITVNAGQTSTCEIVNRKLGQINVTKYNDTDNSGTQNNGEAVLGAWTITLSNGQTAVTDGNGNVSFENLTPGINYILGEEMQPGWTQTDITCTKNNETIATCGDGLVNGEEQCDDSNETNGDGCSSTCQNEISVFKFIKPVNAQVNDDLEDSKQIVLNPGDVWNCYIGNRLLPPTATISKSNDALGDLSPGDSVNFKIIVIISGNDINNFKVTDLPSNGFSYRPASFNVLKNGDTYAITEPVYHSPGVWNLGNLKVGDTLVLTYTADISSDQQPGTYRDLAYAYGQTAYGDNAIVYANGENSLYVSNNFVGTEVPIVKSTQNSVSAGVEKEEVQGEVLGASTELPSTGANTIWLIISGLMFIIGLAFIKKSSMKLIAIIFLAIFSFFAPSAQALDSLSVRLEQPKSPTNLNDLKLTFVALDINNNAITVKCYKKGPSDSSYTQFGSDIPLTAPGNTSQCQTNSSILSSEGTYNFYVTANDEQSNIVSLDYKTSGPGTPSNYRKEWLNGGCDYKINFKTADDGGKTVKVELYRADITDFILDNGSRVASVNIGSNQESSITNTVPDCSKSYYYVLRAFDDAGNGSGTIGDSVTITTTSTTIGTTTTTTGAIPVTNATLAPEEGENALLTGTPSPEEFTTSNEEGTVLGTVDTVKSFLQKSWLPLLLGLIGLFAIIRYALSKKKKSTHR
ncbi:MAG TPA: choice-of-anchor K domain-containing protein [Candidatus Woesebacteria bacterium]|nr:choice-of-anchor K domain-containing protein [Candidatus Woesebacteria bacterium]